MKKIYFYIFLFLLNTNNVFGNEGIFFIDVDYILKNSNSGKIIVNKLKELNSQNQLKFKNTEDEIKSLENEITKLKNIVSKEELDKKIDIFKKKVFDYKKEKNEILNDYNKIKNKELESYFNNISLVIEDFMKKKSIKIILDRKNIFIANSNYDITNELINYLNENIN